MLAEEREVCKHCVKVWVQTQGKCFVVVRPVNVSQSPKQKQKDLLDEEEEAGWKRSTWITRRDSLKVNWVLLCSEI